jgi:hypothetical protein
MLIPQRRTVSVMTIMSEGMMTFKNAPMKLPRSTVGIITVAML